MLPRVWIFPESAREFLRGADLFIDGVDFYAVDTRRMLFRMAAEQGIFAVTAVGGRIRHGVAGVRPRRDEL